MCLYSAAVGTIIVGADHATMMFISIDRAVGCFYKNYRNIQKNKANSFNWQLSAMNCLLTWLIPFILFSPAIFGFTRFMVFGFDDRLGDCHWKPDNIAIEIQDISVLEKVHLTIIVGIVLLSIFLIIASYVYLGLFIKRETDRIASIANSKTTQVTNIRLFRNKL